MEWGPPKKRGSYNCGRCGLPKKGHVCAGSTSRRAFSFDDVAAPHSPGENLALNQPVEVTIVAGGGSLTATCLAEVLGRLPQRELAAVCRRWREVVRRVWHSVEEINLRVSARERIGFVGSVLNKCEGLVKLRLTVERC